MEMRLDFEKDLKRVRRELGTLGDRVVPRAANRALNDTAVTARKETVDNLKGRIGNAAGLSVSGLRKALFLRRSTVRTLMASITASGKPLPLIQFGARRAARGVRAKAWGKSKLYKGAFIAVMPNGHRGVFRRTGVKRRMRKGNYVGQRREVITQMWGPAIPVEFLSDDIQRSLVRVVGRRWPINFERQVNYYVRRFNNG